MTARCVMVLGTTCGAGKSWLCTALCRYYRRQGLTVAPFKAQNMSNNARVVALHAPARPDPAGGEIGSAQYFQALAAGAAPDVRMNPLLLKPEREGLGPQDWVMLPGSKHTSSDLACWNTRRAASPAALSPLVVPFFLPEIHHAPPPAHPCQHP